jgi:L-lactate dehydrogenase (cytochrome)
VVTIDTATGGNRERDYRNGIYTLMSGETLRKIPYLPNVLTHPRWLAGYMLDRGNRRLENLVIPGKEALTLMEFTDLPAHLAQMGVTWKDMEWIRPIWPGPIVVKGIQTDDDARRAIDVGAQGVIVSNHGGRQLDSVAASLRVLPSVVSAVGAQAEVLMDGGIRRGSDVIKALCLGAKAVLMGRACAFGLAAYGTAGVERSLEIIKQDLHRTMKLLGASAIGKLDESYLERSTFTQVNR